MTPPPDDQGPPFPVTPVPPELLDYARQTLDVEAMLAEIAEMKATGGIPFERVLASVEAAMREPS